MCIHGWIHSYSSILSMTMHFSVPDFCLERIYHPCAAQKAGVPSLPTNSVPHHPLLPGAVLEDLLVIWCSPEQQGALIGSSARVHPRDAVYLFSHRNVKIWFSGCKICQQNIRRAQRNILGQGSSVL